VKIVCYVLCVALEATQSELFELKNKFDEEAAARCLCVYMCVCVCVCACVHVMCGVVLSVGCIFCRDLQMV